MAPPIGTIAESDKRQDLLARARARAALIPDMLVEAERVAHSVVGGWHGRKRRGIGDSFWQFRPYDAGESLARIDWRRSARDDAITIKDQEWEAAHTVWIWADRSPSMNFRSDLASVSKQSRALVLAFALVEILVRSGERVGWPGLTKALSSRNAIERIALEVMNDERQIDQDFPSHAPIRQQSDLVIFSDFLGDIETTFAQVDQLAATGVTGTLVQIVDPAEETFPYSGRTKFEDPETGITYTSGRAQNLTIEYKTLFNARKQSLADHCRQLGWHHVVHHTDGLASSALVALYTRLTGETV